MPITDFTPPPIQLERFISRAYDFYSASILVWPTHSIAAAGFLLHTAIELFLKLFLLSRGVPEKELYRKYGHDLIKLFDACVAIDPTLNITGCRENLCQLNEYGAQKGGIRYVNLTSNVYLINHRIHELTNPLAQQIIARVNPNQDVSDLFDKDDYVLVRD